METLESLSKSVDPRVRALVFSAVETRNHVTKMQEGFDAIRDLRARAKVRAMIAENSALADAYTAGAVALQALLTGIALRIVVARLCREMPPAFVHSLGRAIEAYTNRADPGPLTTCPACQPLVAVGNVVPISPSRSTCVVCESTGQVPEAIRMLWNDLNPLLDGIESAPSDRGAP